MYNFILQTIVMLSLAAIIYLFARAMPRVSDAADRQKAGDYIEQLLDRVPFEKADAFVSMVIERVLRKLKVAILKMDNLVTNHLRGMKPTLGPGKNQAAEQLFSGPAASGADGAVEKEGESDSLK